VAVLKWLDDTRHFAPTCRALGLEELLDDARFATPRRAPPNREGAPRPARRPIGSLDLAELRRRLAAEDTVSAAVGVTHRGGPRRAVLANGLLRPASHPNVGALGVRADAVRDDMTEIRRPAPGTGEHTDEILAELGYDGPAVTALRGRRPVA